jgi:hypothetical protein
MAHQDDAAAVFEDLFDGGDGRSDAGVVGYLEGIVEGDIEIHPDKGFFICKAVVAELAHNKWYKKGPVCP